MNVENYDYSEYQSGPNDGLLKKIADGAKKQLELTDDVAKANSDLKSKQAKLVNHVQEVMPKLMQEATLEKTTMSGLDISVEDKIRVSVPAGDDDRKSEAYKWLESNGEGKLVKSTFVINVDNSDVEKVELVKNILGKNKIIIDLEKYDSEDDIKWLNAVLDENEIERYQVNEFDYEYKRSHNPNSLTSVISGKMNKGIDVPQKTFGVFKQKFCKIVKSKKK